VLELCTEALAPLDGLGLDAVAVGHASKEEQQAQRVVQVAHGVHKAGVALLDDVVERVRGLALLQALGNGRLVLAQGLAQLAGKDLVLTELGQQRLVVEEGNVF